jgi:putative peptide zinc metalloprotease protein
MVPHDHSGTAWVFPFDKPLAPGPGDNQALAANTTNGTAEYDVSISMVWVPPGEAATNTNEAYAFASCSDCASVAIAFQVVLVLGDNHVAAPENIAAAVNSDCVNCLTYALAKQLFVTLDGPLSSGSQAQLDAVWAQVAAYADQIESVPLSEIADHLDSFEHQILAIIEADQPGTVPVPSSSATAAASSRTPSPTDATSATDGPSATQVGPTAGPSSAPTASDSATPTEPATTSTAPSP